MYGEQENPDTIQDLSPQTTEVGNQEPGITGSTGDESQIVDEGNVIFKSFVGVNRLPLGSINIGDYLAAGAFGQVYRGSWGERLVALKKIDFEHAAKKLGLNKNQILESLDWEVARLSTVMHPNIVQFYGIYQHQSQDYTYLVMEFCEGGELRKVLQKDADIPWSKRWQWALEISEGLSYLHESGILHRDLKAENVLLDHNGRAKLADLGVAQVDALLAEDEAQVVAIGLQDKKFIAPESIDNYQFSSKSTDIYALGLVFWEIASRKEPRELNMLEYFKDWVKGTHIEREPIPENCPLGFKNLILSCWQHNPATRPTIDQLIIQLKDIAPEFNKNYILVQACEELEKQIYSKRKEGLAYIAPFITKQQVKEPIDEYWAKREQLDVSAQNELPNPPLHLWDSFDNFIKIPYSTTLVLLGEAGLGKTLSTYLWADKLMNQWWAYINEPSTPQPTYLPIFIRPITQRWSHKEIKGAFSSALTRYGLHDINIPLLVFVDGYDELGMDEAPTNLVEHLGLVQYKNTKLVVTCRPSTVDAGLLHQRFNFSDELITRYFLPFSVDQLLGYLKEQLSLSEGIRRDYKQILENSPSMCEVLRNPFVLYLLWQSWETVSKKPLDTLDRSQIYSDFVEHIITTNSILLAQSQLAVDQNLVYSFQCFASEVAFSAYRSKGIPISYLETAKEVKAKWLNLENLVAEASSKEFANRQAALEEESDKGKMQAMRRSLLKEEDYVQIIQKRRELLEAELPLKERTKTYEFTHKSLFEYFMAKRLIQLMNKDTDFIRKEEFKTLMEQLEKTEPDVLLFLYEDWKKQAKGTATLMVKEPGLNIDLEQESTQSSSQVNSYRKAINEVMLLNSIGAVLQEQARHKEAIELLLEALAISEKVVGKEHACTATSYNNIGNVLYSQGKYEEAFEYYSKALVIREKVLGKEHPDTAALYCGIGNVLNDQGKYEKAFGYFSQALSISKKVLGKEHPSIAIPYAYRGIGNVFQAQAKYEEALKYYFKGLTIGEKVLGKEHPDTASSYSCIGTVLSSQGKYEEALVYKFKALCVDEKVLGKEHPNTATSYNNIGSTLKCQGKYKEALVYYFMALIVYEKVLGKEHPNTATIYNNIGSTLKSQGKYEEAFVYYFKHMCVQEKLLGKVHPDTTSSYINIGLTLQSQGKYEEALVYYFKALSVCEKVLGKEHPYTAASYNNINAVLKLGVNINTVNKDGDPVLCLASLHGHQSVVKFLLERGADAEIVDKDGSTALHKASLNGCKEIIGLLLKKGARIDAIDNNGRTAQVVAVEQGKQEVAELLQYFKSTFPHSQIGKYKKN